MNRKSDNCPLGRRGVVWQVFALVTVSLVTVVLVGLAAAEDKAPPVVNAKAAKLPKIVRTA